MKRTIFISRGSVMAIVEGISATIAQHSGGEIGFEKMWASANDAAKLDIWWRSAINDLEVNLRQHVAATTDKFDLQQIGKDYRLTLNLNRYWDDKLTGVLDNKIQEYLVNSVIAGWLSDFRDIKAPDYTAMASGAIADISQIILYRKLVFAEAARATDAAKEAGTAGSAESEARATDEAKEVGTAGSAESVARAEDLAKDTSSIAKASGSERIKDNAEVRIRHDYTDWGNLQPIRKRKIKR